MNIQHFIESQPWWICVVAIGLSILVHMSKKDRENIFRGNTKYLRRAADKIKSALDKCTNEDHLEGVRIMMENFKNNFGHSLQGMADYTALKVIYDATKWNLERDRRYIDAMNEVMLYGQNLMVVDESGHLEYKIA